LHARTDFAVSLPKFPKEFILQQKLQDASWLSPQSVTARTAILADDGCYPLRVILADCVFGLSSQEKSCAIIQSERFILYNIIKLIANVFKHIQYLIVEK